MNAIEKRTQEFNDGYRLAQKEFLDDLYELLNNLNDDLSIDFRDGENGYPTYEDSYKAVKKYTLKVLKNKIEELKKAVEK